MDAAARRRWRCRAVDSPVRHRFVQAGEPLVFLNRRSPVGGDGQRYVGIDNLGAAAEVVPWLHAVRVPHAAYGEAIASALADTSGKTIIFPNELAIRA